MTTTFEKQFAAATKAYDIVKSKILDILEEIAPENTESVALALCLRTWFDTDTDTWMERAKPILAGLDRSFFRSESETEERCFKALHAALCIRNAGPQCLEPMERLTLDLYALASWQHGADFADLGNLRHIPDAIRDSFGDYLPIDEYLPMLASALAALIPFFAGNDSPYTYAYSALNQELVTEFANLDDVNAVVANAIIMLERLHSWQFSAIPTAALSLIMSTIAEMTQCTVEDYGSFIPFSNLMIGVFDHPDNFMDDSFDWDAFLGTADEEEDADEENEIDWDTLLCKDDSDEEEEDGIDWNAFFVDEGGDIPLNEDLSFTDEEFPFTDEELEELIDEFSLEELEEA